MFIHCFGAYFGLAVARVMHNPDVDKSPRHGSMYHSDLFSMVGRSHNEYNKSEEKSRTGHCIICSFIKLLAIIYVQQYK